MKSFYQDESFFLFPATVPFPSHTISEINYNHSSISHRGLHLILRKRFYKECFGRLEVVLMTMIWDSTYGMLYMCQLLPSLSTTHFISHPQLREAEPITHFHRRMNPGRNVVLMLLGISGAATHLGSLTWVFYMTHM